MPRIILGTPIESMTAAEQEQVWLLSRTHDVFIRDACGELWQVLDLVVDEEEKGK